MSLADFQKACFVIMPFGQKKVGDVTVDFDKIYHEIFKPAIAAADTPEGDKLQPHRTDEDLFSASINQDMYEYIKYSRMALADISGSNPNALYELGIRHTVQEAGTVILRQLGHAVPFDIGTIKIFEYKHLDADGITESKGLITKILSETLKRNRLDSPVRQALDRQMASKPAAPSTDGVAAQDMVTRQTDQPFAADIDVIAREAHAAFRAKDYTTARVMNEVILRLDPLNQSARMELGLVNKNDDHAIEAQNEFATLVRLFPEYAEAWREKAVAESLLMRQPGDVILSDWAARAQASFHRATTLNPTDADAFAAWGGVLRRLGHQEEAFSKYQYATEISDGHPYPYLNALKLKALVGGSDRLTYDPAILKKAAAFRQAQVDETPPADTPWCFFDLAVCKLIEGDGEGWLETLKSSDPYLTAAWQPATLARDLRETLVASGIFFARLDEGLDWLDARHAALDAAE